MAEFVLLFILWNWLQPELVDKDIEFDRLNFFNFCKIMCLIPEQCLEFYSVFGSRFSELFEFALWTRFLIICDTMKINN